MGKSTAEEDFTYICCSGTVFNAEKADLRRVVKVTVTMNITDKQLKQDILEMNDFHKKTILPQLNVFRGYDKLNYKIKHKGE